MTAVAKIEPPKNGKRKNEVAPVDATADAWLASIERLAPVVGIEGVRELMTMRREEQARIAEREFNTAMSEAQAELVPVARNQKNKQTGSNYADLAAIAKAAMPIIHAHGFGAITSEFESKKPDHIGIALDVTHRSGHGRRYEFNVPLDGAGIKGNPNKTATHAYSSTLTYGERYAKCKVFGIATEDDDGNAAGGSGGAKIAADDVEKLRSEIMETKTDVASFYALFEIECLEDMPQKELARALRMLELKKNNKRQG